MSKMTKQELEERISELITIMEVEDYGHSEITESKIDAIKQAIGMKKQYDDGDIMLHISLDEVLLPCDFDIYNAEGYDVTVKINKESVGCRVYDIN